MENECSACEQYQLQNIAPTCPEHSTDYEGSQADQDMLEADEMDAYMEAQYERALNDEQDDNYIDRFNL